MKDVLLNLMALMVIGLMLATQVLAEEPPLPLPAGLKLQLAGLIPDAKLIGYKRFRYFGFHVYDAELWRSHAQAAEPDYLKQALALSLHYAKDFKAADIAKRSSKEMRHIEQGTDNQRQQWQDWMAKNFPDVMSGDRLTGVYVPGQPVQFYRNEQLFAQLDDAAFARAFFGIWLDEKTSQPALRAALLGAQ